MSQIRERENVTVKNLRARHADKFSLAERVLDFGVDLVDGQRIRHQSEDILTGRVLIGLYVKMLAVYWPSLPLPKGDCRPPPR